MTTEPEQIESTPTEPEHKEAPPSLWFRLCDDTWFLCALGAAPIFWSALFFIFQPFFDSGWPLLYPKEFLLLVVAYPLLEEVVFRGGLQPYLATKLGKKYACGDISAANWITSLIFTLVHFIQHKLLWSLSVFVPSLLFGYFRDRHNSMVPAIILHIFYNSGYFWLFGFGI